MTMTLNVNEMSANERWFISSRYLSFFICRSLDESCFGLALASSSSSKLGCDDLSSCGRREVRPAFDDLAS